MELFLCLQSLTLQPLFMFFMRNMEVKNLQNDPFLNLNELFYNPIFCDDKLSSNSDGGISYGSVQLVSEMFQILK